MEKLYKKISLESLRSRIDNGMKYVPFDGIDTHTSYGNFLYDLPDIPRTKNLLLKYYWMLGLIREGIKLKNKSDLNLCSASSYSNVFVEDTDYDFIPDSNSECTARDCESITESDCVFNYGVFSIDDFTLDGDEYKPINPLEKTYDRIVLINEDSIDTFNSYGGIKFLCTVYVTIIRGTSTGGNPPYFEIPIALSQDISDIGKMTNYEDEWSDFTNLDGISVDTKVMTLCHRCEERSRLEDLKEPYVFDGVYNQGGINICPSCGSDDVIVFNDNIKNPLISGVTTGIVGYTTNSKLKTLRVKEYFADDNGEILPGLFTKQGRIYKFTYSNGEWLQSSSPSSFNGKTCADGYANEDCNILIHPNLYRTISIADVANKVLSGVTTGEYLFLVKYKNNENTPMTKPYKKLSEGYVLNKFEEDDKTYGDFILSMTTGGDPTMIEFVYVIGGEYIVNGNSYTYIDNTGIKYKELYPYSACTSGTTSLDDYDGVKIFYENIDYEFMEQTIYNSDLMLERSGNTTNIISYTAGDIWTSATSINAPVFKEDYLVGFNEDINISVDVEINRGNAAAFEKHLKLSECNSFSDLENYGNNYYNL